MKIAILNESKMTIGGGFSFIRNFYTGLIGIGDIVNWQEADICLIPSASMISKELFRAVKEAKKKIVLRVDNIPRNSRNRGTGTSRLKMIADNSDGIIYQSEWAKEYVGYFLNKDGIVVYNGIDTSIFNKENMIRNTAQEIYLYSRFNRDETKQWELAWYKYQLIQRQKSYAKLLLVGQFSPEQMQYNFDFYNNEKFQYLGVINQDEEMARVYKKSSYLLATYSNDCYSNTYLESLCCGVELFEPNMSGGTPELIMNYKKGLEFNSCQRMVDDYLKIFQTIL